MYAYFVLNVVHSLQNSDKIRVPTSSENHGKPAKSPEKVPFMESIEFEKKPLNNHEIIMEFCETI